MLNQKKGRIGKSGIFLGLAIFMVLVFMLMFLALPNTAAQINQTAQRLGIDILKTDSVPEVASAWSPPYSGGTYNFTDLDFSVQAAVSISNPSQLTAPGQNTFNKAVDYGSVKDITNTATSWKAKSTSTSAYSHHLWYRDYIFTDTMKAGFRNNLINSVTYTMNIDWSLEFADDGGDIYQNMFVAFGSSSSTTPNLTSFTTLSSAVNSTGKVDVRDSSNGTLDAARTVTLQKDASHKWPGSVTGETLYSTTTLVMRVGAFLFVQPNRSFWGAGATWPITDFQNPNGSALSMSWTAPSVTYKVDGTNNFGAISGSTGALDYINKPEPKTVSTFAFAGTESFTATATAPTANGVYGYYFSGWTSSQTMRFSNKALSFSIRGACDIPLGANTYTVHFRRYELTGAESSYTYAQSGGGTSVQQGPIVPSANPLPNEAAIAGLRAVYTYTSGTYNSINRPTDAATYSLKIDIKDSLNNVYSSSQHVYGFTILPLNITSYSLSLIGTYNYDTTDHSYASPGVRISPSSFTFTLGPVTYVLNKVTDYAIDNFFGDWINSTNNPAVIADPSLRPGLQLNLGATGVKGNFSGTAKAYAEINPLSLSSVSIVTDMNNEIRARYDTRYTGFAIKPEVIMIRLIFGGKEMKLIAHDPSNADPDRQQLYVDNYANFGEVEGYPAYGVYGVGNTAWVSGLFALQTTSYLDNINPSTNTANFTIKIVRANYNEYQNFVGPGGREDTSDVTKVIKFDIPKRIVDDTYDNTTNAVTIVEDYSDADNKPYIGPIVYNGQVKTPHVYYVLIKITNARLWYTNPGTGQTYWRDGSTAYFSLTNASNQAGDPSPPLEFYDTESYADYTVISAGTFLSTLSYTATGKDNVNVVSGGVVNISASSTAKVDGDFQLTFPIVPKQLYSDDCLVSPGGGYILDISDQTYDFGNSLTPSFTAKATYDYSAEGLANDNEVVLTTNDYTVTYSNNTGITKTALVTLEGKNNYVGTITKTFNICALDITSNGNISIQNLENVVYTGTQFSTTSAQLTVDAGVDGTYTVNSSDYSVTGSGTNLNAGPGSFTISFGGYVAGAGALAGTGPNFAGTKTVTFTILPKNINSGNISKTATWVSYDSSLVTYDGNAKTNLPIVTSGTVKTVVVKDNDRSGVELTYSTTSGSGDYMLAATETWGTNPNAGLESGSVKFIGIKNYTGEVTVPFQILPKSVTSLLNITLYTGDGSGYNQSLNGYSFTGSRIEPVVTKVEVDRGGAGMLELSLINDYLVSYGTADPQKNVFATKGGVVTITGTGNYKDSQTKTFNILPIDQQVTFVNPTQSDADIKVESITKVTGHTYYADFEINADNLQGREILLEARTTAIYPSARLIKFTAFPSSANITVSGITYISCTLQEIEGVTYSVTTAKITITTEKRYGRIRVEAEQFDNETLAPVVTIGATEFRNEGNYKECSYSSVNPNNNTTYWFFLKKYDSLDPQYSVVNKTYGNNEFTIPRNKLASYLTTNPTIYSSIGIESSDSEKVSVTPALPNWNITIRKAGTCTLTLSHSGYVVNESSAYLAFSIDIPVTIYKRNLVISFAPSSTVYGTEASFTYTYTTSATDPAKGTDGYTGLSYQMFSDLPSDIMTGMIINYDKDGTHKESTAYYDNGAWLHQPYQITVTLGATGSKASNYNITSSTGSLTVERKQLTASVSNIGQPNVIRKEYGQDNPTADNVSYEGWIPGETMESLLLLGVPFTPPALQYQTLIGDPIQPYTSIGTYTITLSGGSSKNYSIPTATVTCIVVPVAPSITLDSIATTYQAKTIGYPYNDYDEYSNPVVKQASINPVGELASLPRAGLITYQYRFEEQPPSGDKPRRAGTYSTRVIYKAEDGDNYKDATVDFINNIVIAKAIPSISLGLSEGETQFVRNFTGQAIDPLTIQPIVSGVGTDKPVGGSIVIQFRETGETEWVSEIVSAGTYDLYIKFIASPTDNYTNYDNPDQPFTAALLIKDGVVDIELQAGCRVIVDFDGFSHSFDLSKVKFYGSPTDLDEFGFRKEIPGTALVTYSKNGVSWSSEAPINAGIYTVSIDYTTTAGTDYEGNTVTFNKYKGQDLFTIFKKNIKDYMSISFETAMQFTYDAEYHIIPSNLVTLGKIAEDTVGPTGVVTVGYQLSGMPLAPELYTGVKEVGSYDILLVYTEGPNDNYVYTISQRIQAKLIINPAAVQISYASLANVYNFSGDAHRVGVSMVGVKGETPKGTLIFEYKLSGEETFTSSPPVNAGSYDIRVTYQRRIDIIDNYAATSDRKDNIVTINKISPIIVINDMIVDFGVINAQYTPDVILRGASRDLIGPPLTNTNGTSTVSYEYGIFADSKYNWYQWTSSSFPIESGKYSVRATYNPSYDTDSRNYLTATAVRFMCLEIRNIAPVFALNGKTVYYNGASIPASSVSISNAGGINPPGNISYEYKKQGTFVWRNSPPAEVGIYDVRVKYLESPKGDSFSSFTQVFTGALEILALPITIVPLMGQGNVFGTSAIASGEIIYSYYYELNGMKHFVYPSVFDSRYGENVQVGIADYIAEDGYAYSLDMVGGVACRDYSWTPISILTASFDYVSSAGTEVEETIDYSSLVFNGTLAEFIASGREYLLDASTGLVRHKNYFENIILNYGTRNGHFFSVVGKDGRVENTEILERQIIWLNTDRTIGNFDVVRDGYTIRYTINFNNMTAVAGNKTYPIRSSSGYVSYADSSETFRTILIDENEMYNRNLQTDSALYKAADGYVYEIDFGGEKATRLYPIRVNDISFSYEIEDEYTSETQELSVQIELADLELKYSNQSNIYDYYDQERGLYFVLDMEHKLALKDMRYKLLEGPVDDFFEYTMFDGSVRRIDIGYNAYQNTDRPGVYLFQDSIYQSGSYYVDTNLGYVRRVENKVDFGLGLSQILYMESGNPVTIDVDFHNLYFNTIAGDVLARRVTIFGKKYVFSAPSLITGNVWTGNMRAQLAGAGGYPIEKGTMDAGTNYQLNMSASGIKYTVDRAPLYVTFNGPSNNVYDGISKDVTYDVFGLIGNDNVEILGLLENMEGDNVAATRAGNNGFRLRLSIDINNRVGANYYLANSVSTYYFINPAVMETISFTPISGGIVYDGRRHELKLEDEELDSSYTVRYNGKENIPSFVNPGTYHVTAMITKDNYIPQTVNLSLTINKATYSVTPDPITRKMYYGENMPSLTCSSEEGAIRFIDGQYLHPAITEYHWEFVPFRTDFYEFYQGLPENNYLIKGVINLTVHKAQASLQISGSLVQLEETPSALLPLINGKSDSAQDLTVFFKASDGTVYNSLPTAPGKYTVVVEYAGDEFYENTVYETTLTIKEKENMLWLWITGGAIVALALLSALFFIVRKQKTYA